jgi:hypothetical protein
MIDTMQSDMKKIIFSQMIEVVMEHTSDYQTLSDEIDELKNLTIQELDCFDELSTLVALEVCKNSARLWLSQSAGGEGLFDEISGTSQRSTTISSMQARSFWKTLGKIICGDAVGAFSGFCQGAMPYLITGGAANPISNAVLAGHTIRGAVSGSVSAGVSSAIK